MVHATPFLASNGYQIKLKPHLSFVQLFIVYYFSLPAGSSSTSTTASLVASIVSSSLSGVSLMSSSVVPRCLKRI